MFFSLFFRRVLILALPVVLIAGSSFAAGPMETVKEITERTINILTDEELMAPERDQEKRELLRQAADEFFDWEGMAQTALSVHWRERTPAERKEFTELFADFLDKTYMDRIEDYSGERIEYLQEEIDKDFPDEATVKANVITAENKAIPVEYLMIEMDDGSWKVYDVLIEGVSLLRNYTSQFNSIILRSSYEELIEMLRERVGEKS